MPMRVTDLEKFSLEEIWRPYQIAAGYGEDRLVAAPMSIAATARELRRDTDWSRAVLFRLRQIEVDIPSYIIHPLADVVRGAMKPKQEPSQ